jgi:hypothetical protein
MNVLMMMKLFILIYFQAFFKLDELASFLDNTVPSTKPTIKVDMKK